MNRPRKSIVGTGKAGAPVRIDMSIYGTNKLAIIGSGRLTPSPHRLTAGNQQLGFRKGHGVSPVRASDLSPREASILFSVKKSSNMKTPKSTSKTRRCLYQDKSQPSSCSQSVVPSEPAVKGLCKPGFSTRTSQIPKPSTVLKSRKVASSAGSSTFRKPGSSKKVLHAPITSSRVCKASTSSRTEEQANVANDLRDVVKAQQEALQEHRKIIQEQRDLLEVIKSSAEEQKAMFSEAKGSFFKILEEQRSILEEQRSMISEAKGSFFKILEEQRSILEEQRLILRKGSTSSDTEFVLLEKAVSANSESNTLEDSKENIKQNRKSVSEVAYGQMRRSLRCLGTPTLTYSSKKSKTPRIGTPKTFLSNKVRAQLHNLLDD